MKFALIQYNPRWENKAENQEKILTMLGSLESGVDVIVFPELTLTGFTMRSKKFSESDSGETVGFFSALARDKSVHVLAGFIEEFDKRYYNALVHIDTRGKIRAKYRKIHPFSFSGENRHYAGGLNPVISDIGPLRAGLSICYDLRFPELYRTYAQERVELVINIANWPVDRVDHWYTLLKARAIENQACVVGVNRVGDDKGNHYAGWSAAFGPAGKEIVLVKEQESIAYAVIDKNEIAAVRQKFPFLNDIKLI